MAMASERVWRLKGAPEDDRTNRNGNNWNGWSSGLSNGKSVSAARRERRHFAEIIAEKLEKLDSVEKLVVDLQTTLYKMEGAMVSVFGMLTSQQQGVDTMDRLCTRDYVLCRSAKDSICRAGYRGAAVPSERRLGGNREQSVVGRGRGGNECDRSEQGAGHEARFHQDPKS